MDQYNCAEHGRLRYGGCTTCDTLLKDQIERERQKREQAQREELAKHPPGFLDAVRPLMKWCAEHGPKDCGVIVTSTHSELLSSLDTYQTPEFITTKKEPS